jgi:hypothetical protein
VTQTQTERNQRYRDGIKLWFMEYRRGLSCQECGEDHEACIAFHHVDPNEKKYAVADMANRGCSIKTIKRELDKCVVLCHNCHAKLHFHEKERPCVTRSQRAYS